MQYWRTLLYPSSTLKMETMDCSETLINTSNTARNINPKVQHLNLKLLFAFIHST